MDEAVREHVFALPCSSLFLYRIMKVIKLKIFSIANDLLDRPTTFNDMEQNNGDSRGNSAAT
ncbi:hypothetical protein [uncultured Planococcus sp.]|uniref:hypothetical protein n=1 Tax=uncultured Planococcus sp. TaxID=337815 RepID=UPI002601CF90|nr:hypothetical protein [uncultured Planococcus sp.]